MRHLDKASTYNMRIVISQLYSIFRTIRIILIIIRNTGLLDPIYLLKKFNVPFLGTLLP